MSGFVFSSESHGCGLVIETEVRFRLRFFIGKFRALRRMVEVAALLFTVRYVNW